jgi:hypothetical protein
MNAPVLISIIIPILILIANIIYQNSRDHKKNYDRRIDDKVDKDDYEKDMKATNARLKKCEDVTSILMDIKQEQAATRTDIVWIKKGMEEIRNTKDNG